MNLNQKNITDFIQQAQKRNSALIPCINPENTKKDSSLSTKLIEKINSFCELPQQEDLPKTTHFIFVIDSSGSMTYGKEITVKGYNDQIAAVINEAANTGETYVTFIDFNTVVNVRQFQVDAQLAPKLTMESYVTEGGTALYDAMGVALEKSLDLKNIRGKNTGVFISLLTDGEENSSLYLNGAAIQSIMAKLEPLKKFTFGLMGPNKSL